MTSKLTRDRLQEIAEDGFLKHGESKELARMALAAMDSEPVAYMYDGEDGTEYNGHNEFSGGGKGIPLYRHAQTSSVVPDDIKLRELFDSWFASDCSFDQSPEASEEDNIAWRESYWYVWQRCRAAMLQVGNSPVIPDGSKEALSEAVAAIYFTDSTDYLPALYSVVNALSPEVFAQLLSNEKAAFDATRLPAAPQEVK
ncbi:hypothetical protein AB3X34_04500 [Raoultella terrigena]|uniref:hypothetical protein n=1 Tax=Raoultella terrigena TaxID=577 RepID=UPI00349FBAE5